MFISGSIFADNALENFSLKVAKSLDAGSYGWDVVAAVCLIFYFFFLMTLFI